MAINPLTPIVLNVSATKTPSVPDLTRKHGFISFGETTETVTDNAVAFSVNANNWTEKSKNKDADNAFNSFCKGFFSLNPTGVLTIIEVGAKTDGETEVEKIKPIIDGGLYATYCLWLSFSDSIADYKASLKTLFSSYSGEGVIQHFGIEVKKENVADLEDFKGLESVFLFVRGSVSTCGRVAGVMSGSLYAITQQNKMTPLQYKKVSGAEVLELSTTELQTYAENNYNFIATFNGEPCIMVGKYANGTAWDYRFSADTFLIRANAFLVSRLYSGANVPASRIAYTQKGIEQLLAVVNGQASWCVDAGLLSNFGEGLADDGVSLVNEGTFYAVDFKTYIAQNPDKYAEGVYEGISGALQVGRYFRQVVINVVLA